MVTFGGPTIWISTESESVELYWWGDRASWPLSHEAVAALDEWAEEMWGCCEMSIFISRPDLLEKLIERKRENIESGIDAFHVNMDINQAIGIMNRMEAYDIPFCPNCGEQSEMAFMLGFARTKDFGYEVTRKQLRSLWTAYCIRRDYEPDTAHYDSDIFWIWKAIQENDSCPWGDIEENGEIVYGYGDFERYMCEEVL
jgi:hypothetical protein